MPSVDEDVISINDAKTDRFFYNGIMLFLGTIALVSLVGSLIFSIYNPEQEIHSSIIALGSAAIGALACALASALRD